MIEPSDIERAELPPISADYMADLEEENDRLRAALQFYARPELYKEHPHGPGFDRRDLSFHARAALEGPK